MFLLVFQSTGMSSYILYDLPLFFWIDSMMFGRPTEIQFLLQHRFFMQLCYGRINLTGTSCQPATQRTEPQQLLGAINLWQNQFFHLQVETDEGFVHFSWVKGEPMCIPTSGVTFSPHKKTNNMVVYDMNHH